MRTLETDLPGDRNKGRPVDVCVRHSGDEVGRPRAERGEANTGIRREPAVDVRHEGGALFVPREDEADLVAVCERRVEREGLLAGDAKDVADALVLETAHKKLGDVQSGDLLIVAESTLVRLARRLSDQALDDDRVPPLTVELAVPTVRADLTESDLRQELAARFVLREDA